MSKDDVQRAESNLDSFLSLWKRRRWLAIILCIVLLSFALWPILEILDVPEIIGLRNELTQTRIELNEAKRAAALLAEQPQAGSKDSVFVIGMNKSVSGDPALPRRFAKNIDRIRSLNVFQVGLEATNLIYYGAYPDTPYIAIQMTPAYKDGNDYYSSLLVFGKWPGMSIDKAEAANRFPLKLSSGCGLTFRTSLANLSIEVRNVGFGQASVWFIVIPSTDSAPGIGIRESGCPKDS